MKPHYTFQNIDATEGLKKHTAEKLTKINKYVHRHISVHVIFNVEHLEHIVEINLEADGSHFLATDRQHDMYASIDGAVEKIITQLRKSRDRMKKACKTVVPEPPIL